METTSSLGFVIGIVLLTSFVDYSRWYEPLGDSGLYLRNPDSGRHDWDIFFRADLTVSFEGDVSDFT
jgi:hypothetical protein